MSDSANAQTPRPAEEVGSGPGVADPVLKPRRLIESDIGMSALEDMLRKLEDPESPSSRSYLSLPQIPLADICGRDNLARLSSEDRKLLEERDLDLTKEIQHAEWQGAAGRWALVAEAILEGRDRTLRTSSTLPPSAPAGAAAQVGAALIAEVKQIMKDIPVARDDKCYMSIGGARIGESRIVTFTRASAPVYFELKEAPARLRAQRVTRLRGFLAERGYIPPDALTRR